MIAIKTRAVRTALVFFMALSAPAHGGVIPLPGKIVPGEGSFAIGAATVVQVPKGDRQAENAARYLAELWQRSNALALPIAVGPAASASDSTIAFRRTQGFGPEEYELDVQPHRIVVSASAGAGRCGNDYTMRLDIELVLLRAETLRAPECDSGVRCRGGWADCDRQGERI